MIHCPFSEWSKNWYWNIPCFTGWAVSGDYSRFQILYKSKNSGIEFRPNILKWYVDENDFQICTTVYPYWLPRTQYTLGFSLANFFFPLAVSSKYLLLITYSFTFEWWYCWNNDLRDAFFTDSRGDERFHMPIGLVKLVHFTQTEPEQFYQPDCARGQCKNQCLWVQLTLLIVHLYLYCVTRAPLLYFIRSWVALSFKVVSQ